MPGGVGAFGSAGTMAAGGSSTDLLPIEDYSTEPPLLQELGVDFGHIRTKVTAVLMLSRPIEPNIMADTDMAGPLVFCLVLGFCLLLVRRRVEWF
jgi:protein YIPF5/7